MENALFHVQPCSTMFNQIVDLESQTQNAAKLEDHHTSGTGGSSYITTFFGE